MTKPSLILLFALLGEVSLAPKVSLKGQRPWRNTGMGLDFLDHPLSSASVIPPSDQAGTPNPGRSFKISEYTRAPPPDGHTVQGYRPPHDVLPHRRMWQNSHRHPRHPLYVFPDFSLRSIDAILLSTESENARDFQTVGDWIEPRYLYLNDLLFLHRRHIPKETTQWGNVDSLTSPLHLLIRIRQKWHSATLQQRSEPAPHDLVEVTFKSLRNFERDNKGAPLTLEDVYRITVQAIQRRYILLRPYLDILTVPAHTTASLPSSDSRTTLLERQQIPTHCTDPRTFPAILTNFHLTGQNTLFLLRHLYQLGGERMEGKDRLTIPLDCFSEALATAKTRYFLPGTTPIPYATEIFALIEKTISMIRAYPSVEAKAAKAHYSEYKKLISHITGKRTKRSRPDYLRTRANRDKDFMVSEVKGFVKPTADKECAFDAILVTVFGLAKQLGKMYAA